MAKIIQPYVCFYWRCIKEAASGTIDLANAWSGVIGLAIVVGFWRWRGWPLTPPSTYLGVGIHTLVFIASAWLMFFIIRFIGAPCRLIARKQLEITNLSAKVADLEEALKPKLRCFFSATDPGCVRPNTQVQLSSAAGVVGTLPSTYFRLSVESIGFDSLVGCAGRMTEIKKNGQVVVAGENLQLTFAPGENADSICKTIHNSAPEYLDFLVIAESNVVWVPTYQSKAPSSIAWNTLFTDHAEYRFHIIVTAPAYASIAYDVVLNWTGDHRTARVYAA